MPTSRAQVVVAKYKYETFETEHGKGYRFTQPKGQSLTAICLDINKASDNLVGRGIMILLRDPGMTSVPKDEVVHEFVLVRPSSVLSPDGIPQLLIEKGMITASRAAVMLSGGLQRLCKGFPKELNDPGIAKDEGDICMGQVVVTAQGMIAFDTFGAAFIPTSDANHEKGTLIAGVYLNVKD